MDNSPELASSFNTYRQVKLNSPTLATSLLVLLVKSFPGISLVSRTLCHSVVN